MLITLRNEMPKAGRYDYPSRDVDACLDLMKLAHEKTRNFANNRTTFAEAIGQSPKTGPYGLLIGSIGMYGLADTGDGHVRYTELAKKALFGLQNEIDTARRQAVHNVPLFADIYEKFGNHVDVDQLRIFLRDTGGVEIAEAPEKALEVSKIYKKVVGYLFSEDAAEEKPKVDSDQKMNGHEERNIDSNSGSGMYKDYVLAEGIVIKVPKELAEDAIKKAWRQSKAAMDIFLELPAENPKASC
jgi:hypothetical protein